jgi:hypothetical protein
MMIRTRLTVCTFQIIIEWAVEITAPDIREVSQLCRDFKCHEGAQRIRDWRPVVDAGIQWEVNVMMAAPDDRERADDLKASLDGIRCEDTNVGLAGQDIYIIDISADARGSKRRRRVSMVGAFQALKIGRAQSGHACDVIINQCSEN